MLRRFLPILTILLISAAPLRAEPISWIEVAKAGGDGGGVKPVPGAAGGSVVGWFDRGATRLVSLHLANALPNAIVYLRYARGIQTPGSVDFYLAPPGVTKHDDAKAKSLGHMPLPFTQSWDQFQWAQAKLGAISAGDATLLMVCNDEHSSGDLNLLGVANDEHHGLWQPPNEVKDGKLFGNGTLLVPVIITAIAGPSLGNLLAGKTYLGPNAQPAKFVVSIQNRSDQPQTATIDGTLTSDAGVAAIIAASQLKLPPSSITLATIDVKPPDFGWYGLQVKTHVGENADSHSTNLCVIRPAAVGVRPDSVFGLNIGPDADNLKIASLIGVKWRRGIPVDAADSMNAIANIKGTYWPGGQSQIDQVRASVQECKAAGVLCLGYINYAPRWLMAKGPNGQSDVLNRPTDMQQQAEVVYQTIKPLHDLVSTWEIWNEPWIHAYTWATGTAQDFRDMTRANWDRMQKDLPDVKIVGGGSVAYHRDVVFAQGSKNAGYLDGLTNHPYGPPVNCAPSVPAQDSWMLQHWGKGKGDGGLWYTEFGTFEGFFPQYAPPERKFMVARALAPLYSMFKLGAGQTQLHLFAWLSRYDEDTGAGDGANWWDMKNPLPAVAAYSAMTHFLEDGSIVRDIYAATRCHWAIEFTKLDHSIVTAYFPSPGPDGADMTGTMSLPAEDFQVYDYLARQIGKVDRGLLSFPVRSWEVRYIVSHESADQVRKAFNDATWAGLPSVMINPRSFSSPLSDKPSLRVKVENLLPRTIDAALDVQPPPDLQLATTHADVQSLKPGETRFIEFPLQSATPNALNRYRIDYSADVSGNEQTGSQIVQVACATFGTPSAIDGDLSDWSNVAPVTMLSHSGKDYAALVADPTTLAKKMAAHQAMDSVIYRFWTRWDDKNFYVAAEAPVEKLLPHPRIQDDPYTFPFVDSQSLQIAVGCGAVNPDNMLKGWPMYEKSGADDVDYEFIASMVRDAQGRNLPELQRLAAPGTNKQTYYETNAVTTPATGLMDATPPRGKQGQIAIVYEPAAKQLRYEIAIPWTELEGLHDKVKRLSASQSTRVHLAFRINDTGDASHGGGFWTTEAGDVEAGSYGFSPHWGGGQPVQGGRVVTDWGFTRSE